MQINNQNMAFFKDRLKMVKALLFDVDGVLSSDMSPLDENGDPMRTSNVKDGFAIREALKNGIIVGVITGGPQKRVKSRHLKLGVQHYYDQVEDKLEALADFTGKTGIDTSAILYMGDDLADYHVMKRVGISACPSDAVPEIKAISMYISDRRGGEGCVRDVIEQVLRAQEKWFVNGSTGQQSY